jgi:UDP-N-acetylmuramate dehydrogenase
MFQYNVPLKNHTTFQVGGPAKYFCKAQEKNQLEEAIAFAKSERLPYFILGGGSNLLVSDKGFDGLIIKLKNDDFKVKSTRIFTQAGAGLGEVAELAASKGLSGLEWAVGIPGTIGGAIRGNAGAFGHYFSDSVEAVETIDENFVFCSFDNPGCCFGYRESIFKHNNQIIFSSILKLQPDEEEKIRERMDKNLSLRKEKQPLGYGSAGSVFKNPQDKSAGRLIEEAGLKREKVGGAIVSEKHANFIINLGSASAKDIKALIDLTKKEVKKQTGYQLEEEIQYLGF